MDILVWQKRPFHNLTKYTSCKKTKQKKHLKKNDISPLKCGMLSHNIYTRI